MGAVEPYFLLEGASLHFYLQQRSQSKLVPSTLLNDLVPSTLLNDMEMT